VDATWRLLTRTRALGLVAVLDDALEEAQTPRHGVGVEDAELRVEAGDRDERACQVVEGADHQRNKPTGSSAMLAS
jgi:hypothetical protein